MLVVDATCLYATLLGGPGAEQVRRHLATDDDQAAPHVVDAEVLAAIRRAARRGTVDRTAAVQMVEDLADWPGQRFGHRPLLERAWELRGTLRAWDGLYVALAELMGGRLLTLDARLAELPGLRCPVVVPG